MPPGSKRCLFCKGCQLNCYMFLRIGFFAKRTFIDEQMMKELEGYMSKEELVQLCWEETTQRISISGGHQLIVCSDCCKILLKNDPTMEYFLGYLSIREHFNYRKFARLADTLHTNGFVVVQNCDAQTFTFPSGELLDLCKRNKPSPLTRRTEYPQRLDLKSRWDRSWIQFKNINDTDQHWKTIGEQLGRVISPDIYFGRLAILNRQKRESEGIGQGNPIGIMTNIQYTPSGQSVLYKANGLKSRQMPHVDADHGAFNVVEALTNNYKIKVWTGSHFLPLGDEDSKNNKDGREANVSGYGSMVTLKRGERLIFHSNLIHHGVESCGDKDNFTVLRKQFMESNKNTFQDIKWFGVGKNAEHKTISDFSIHYTLDFTLGRHSIGDFQTGKISTKMPKWISPIEEKNDEAFKDQKKEIYRNYHSKIEQNSRIYKNNKAPENRNDIMVVQPCGQLILDVYRAYDVFMIGDVSRQNTPKRKRRGVPSHKE